MWQTVQKKMGNYSSITTILEKINRKELIRSLMDLAAPIDRSQEGLSISQDELAALYIEFRTLNFVCFDSESLVADSDSGELADIWVSEVHDFENRISKVRKWDLGHMPATLQKQVVDFEDALRKIAGFPGANEFLILEMSLAPYRTGSYKREYFKVSSTVVTSEYRETLAPLCDPEKNLRRRS